MGAVGVATSDEHGTSQGAQQVVAFVAPMTLMKYGREHELEADALGVQIMSDAGSRIGRRFAFRSGHLTAALCP